MTDYLVTWAIDVEGAETPIKAAQEARRIQLNPTAIVGVFDVKDAATGRTVRVDLDEDEEITRPGPPALVDMSAEDCRQVLQKLADMLWPEGNAEHEHGADELGEIANTLYFLRPADPE